MIGPNGAGKSSALNLINGVYRADSGSIVFDGRIGSNRFTSVARPRRLGIGRTFQHNALFKHMRVIDNVMVGLSRVDRSGIVQPRLPPAARPKRGTRRG